MEKNWFVYIVETEKGLLYTGITTNLKRRFQEHLKGKKGAKFFNLDRPKRIAYLSKVKNRSLATKIEISIKKLPKIKKLELIKSNYPETRKYFLDLHLNKDTFV